VAARARVVSGVGRKLRRAGVGSERPWRWKEFVADLVG
jgi:hypothetical protein